MNTEQPIREVPFFKPSFDRSEEEAAVRVLHSGWLTTGKETLAFEQDFAEMVHSPYALAVNSASNGLMLAMDAFGVGEGTKILTSPYTFVSTATSALHLGGEVVYADIAADSYSIDPEKIEEKLKHDKAIKAIVPIHIAGNLCDMKAITALAVQYGVAVIEDAAHAFPAKTADGYGGTFGDAGVFSFYATKTITTGEGGMICLRNPEAAERIKLMRSHGINRTIWDRYTDKHASWKSSRYSVGNRQGAVEKGRRVLPQAEAHRRTLYPRLCTAGFFPCAAGRGGQRMAPLHPAACSGDAFRRPG